MIALPKEIVKETFLCDTNGLLHPEAVGWSRKPLHICTLSGSWPRKKKWEYWCITGDRFLFSATIAHIDYLSLGALYFLEYDTLRYAEQAGVRFFSRYPQMADTFGQSVSFSTRTLAITFAYEQSSMTISATSPTFSGKPLNAHIRIEWPEGQESLNVVVPWDRKRFQFTSKQECLPAKGMIHWGDETFAFTPGRTWGCLDFGRGIWPYRTAWNWASFSGQIGEDIVGLNMGGKWTDGTGMNENGILLNGRLFKIHEDIVFEYDSMDFMRPWHMHTTHSDTLDLEFTPFYDRSGSLNLLLLRTRTHQLFGRFSGRLNVEGCAIEVREMVGWAEEHLARW